MAAALMVQGTSSWAGKSLITTAFCRHFARAGVRVAPFKAQNMSNNARVVAGGEIGVAQYLQARAAGVEPDIRMNPVLVKPEDATRSQVIVRGRASPEIGALPWRERAPHLWPAVAESLDSLLDEYDLIVLEGAGSPAEINLSDCDLTNSRAAEAADAAVVLVCDIDRGGAFAHLYGTWALLGAEQRERIAGFVLNRFRGDQSLLAPAPERLTEMTGMASLGVVPWIEHGLPDEDGAATPVAPAEDAPVAAVVRYPFASNLDEFKAMEQVAAVRWARRPADLDGAALVVLPGSKHVAADLAWLRSTGLDRALASRVRDREPVLGICGGLQMLGEELRDEAGVDGDATGLGLLPLRTVYGPEKLTRPVGVRFAQELGTPWASLAGVEVSGGYEIRHGRSEPTAPLLAAIPGGLGWADGPLLAVCVHGVMECPDALAALFGKAPERSLDDAIDDLTDAVMGALDSTRIESLIAG
jgi:adenosylcobyric acid synthase